VQDFMTVNLFEVHLHRANIEYRKLDKYYNYRQEEVKKGKNNFGSNLKIASRREIEMQKEAANDYRKDKAKKGEADANKKD